VRGAPPQPDQDALTRRRAIILGLSALSLAGLGRVARAGSATEIEAVKAAARWLALVDEGKVDESWNEAATLFKTAVTPEQWRSALDSSRRPLSRLLSRKVRSKQAMTSLPGVPDGRYVVIRYAAVYESRVEAIETVTPMLDRDGKWRVSSYFIG
jgi:predicted exporter